MSITRIQNTEELELLKRLEWDIIRKDIKKKLGFKVDEDGYVYLYPDVKWYSLRLTGQAQIYQASLGFYILELFGNGDLESWKSYCKKSNIDWDIRYK